MTVRSFNVTMATAPKPYTVSQAMHSGAENYTKDEVVFCCWEWLAICWRKKKGRERETENGDLVVILNQYHKLQPFILFTNNFFTEIAMIRNILASNTHPYSTRINNCDCKSSSFDPSRHKYHFPALSCNGQSLSWRFDDRYLAFRGSDGPTLETSASISFYGVNLTIINSLDAKFLYFTFLPTLHHSFSYK